MRKDGIGQVPASAAKRLQCADGPDNACNWRSVPRWLCEKAVASFFFLFYFVSLMRIKDADEATQG
jgi:hypothetical protein